MDFCSSIFNSTSYIDSICGEYMKMTDNTNKQLKGNQLSFDAGIKNFKADGSDVVITLVADSKKINLNTLNEIA
ncbi:hypothetical protein [Lactobacillus phage phiadh]|uniref:hypothetical protein n=1 Tax=Lactobacillus phage phiadh TaxID=12417 RepID=UPI000009B69E|nr:hypothetical protein phiadhp32 [Lactobacillus phage phiadh]MBT1276963.1 hypothetical protein [Lactobacillus paragasseri]CAB52510.1 hypothetical protein [Lactobacillus phage phiadh]